jgi:hypothetical protein
VLLITIHHTEIRGPGQIPAAVAAALGKPIPTLAGFSVKARYAPGAPGCLPRFRVTPPRRFGFTAGGVLPGSSSFDGGIDELPLLRESRCSSRASRASSSSMRRA